MNCKGVCRKHGKPCLATVESKALRMAEMATRELCGKRINVNGLKLWVEKHPKNAFPIYENEIGDIDADDADCILQYALFGELVFG